MTSEKPEMDAPTRPPHGARRIAGQLLVDVGYAVFWALLVVAIALGSGVVSQFAYVDF